MNPTRSEPVARGPGSSEDDRDATDRKGPDAGPGARLRRGQRGGGPPFPRGQAFTGADRGSVYEFVRRALVRLDYGRLGKSDKGLVRRYLAKVTGRSRAQPTRLIGQHRETGRIEDRRGGAPAHPFERRYTRADVRRLAVVDAAMGQMSGPATRALMRRQYERFGDGRFERLAGLSNGHLYNPRFRGGRLCAAR